MSLTAQWGSSGLCAMVIVTPSRKGSVLAAGNNRSIMRPSGSNWMLPLVIFHEEKSGLRKSSASYVNCPVRRKAMKAREKAARRSQPFGVAGSTEFSS